MSKRLITVRSGKEEIQMEVTEEEYQKYYRPWWLQKKREQRNREAMEEHGYREESYEQWKENDMKSELFSDSLEELTEKKEMLGWYYVKISDNLNVRIICSSPLIT